MGNVSEFPKKGVAKNISKEIPSYKLNGDYRHVPYLNDLYVITDMLDEALNKAINQRTFPASILNIHTDENGTRILQPRLVIDEVSNMLVADYVVCRADGSVIPAITISKKTSMRSLNFHVDESLDSRFTAFSKALIFVRDNVRDIGNIQDTDVTTIHLLFPILLMQAFIGVSKYEVSELEVSHTYEDLDMDKPPISRLTISVLADSVEFTIVINVSLLLSVSRYFSSKG